MRKSVWVKWIFIVVAGVFLLVWFWYVSERRDRTEIIFLSVGEGDAILIVQGNHQVLIDGGRDGQELLYRLGKYVPFWDRRIETVIATHPDADHIGGLPELVRRYRIGIVLDTGVRNDTESFAIWEQELERNRLRRAKIIAGTRIRFPEGGDLLIEYPKNQLSETLSETNEGSIVSRFLFGETDFLLTGDLPNEEVHLFDESEVEVLKVAHHGSKYSTSDRFLDLVRPQEAVISVGDNAYGHPAPEVLARLLGHGALIRRTDTDGDIRYRCDREMSGCRYVP